MTAKLSKPDIDAEARAWFVRLLQEPTARNRATFEAWRQADPAHAEAFRAVALTWEAAEQPGKRLAEAEADELSVYLKAMDGAKDRRKSSRRLAGAAVILACLLGTAVWLERPNIAALSPSGMLGLAYMAAGPMAVCYLTWFGALQRLPTSVAATAMLLVPIIGTVSAVPLLGDSLGIQEAIAIALTLSGVGLALRSRAGS